MSLNVYLTPAHILLSQPSMKQVQVAWPYTQLILRAHGQRCSVLFAADLAAAWLCVFRMTQNHSDVDTENSISPILRNCQHRGYY